MDAKGREWFVDVGGSFTVHRGGLQRVDVVWRAIGRAAALRTARGVTPFLLLSSHLPKRASDGDAALRAAGPDVVTDVIDMQSADALARLAAYGDGGVRPALGFWTADDLSRR
jgi:hypothetical protein